MKIGLKLIAGFLTVACILGFSGFYTVLNLNGIKDNSENIENIQFQGYVFASKMKLAVVQVQQWLTDISATRAAEGFDDGFDEAESWANVFTEYSDSYKDLAKSYNDQELLTELTALDESFDAFYTNGKEMAQAYIDGGPELGNVAMEGFDAYAADMGERIDAINEEATLAIEATFLENSNAIATFQTVTIIVVVMAVIFSIAIALFILRSITKPIAIIGNELKELADTGDLSKRSSIKTNDEIGVMAASLNDMLDKVTGSVSDLAKTADAIAGGDKSAKISQDVLSQNNEIGKLGSSFNEMLLQITDKNKIDESFLYGIPDPAFKTDNKLVIQDANDAFLKALGYNRSEVVGKMTCSEVCKTPICNTSNCTIKKCIDTKGTVVTEAYATTRNGKKIPIRAACGVLLNSKNEPVGGFELIQDLTALNEMVTNVEKVATGDLTVMVDESYKARDDSTGLLAKSLDKMVGSVKGLIGNVKNSVDTLANSAQKLSASSQEVNASAEETTSSVQQIANGASKASEESGNVLKEIKIAEEAATKGQVAANSISSRMDEIKKTTLEGSNKIASLGEKSKDIGNIVNTINQISEQTNLLALNAAIEAARAGEAGRGFAVVADEVRKLAEESGQATQQISNLIQGIQSEIDSAVKSMKENSKSVDEGSKDIQAAVEAFGRLPPVIEAINKAAGEVSSIAQENAASSEETSSATEEVTSTMSQVTNAASELTDIAGELQKQISQFKIGESNYSLSSDKSNNKNNHVKELNNINHRSNNDEQEN